MKHALELRSARLAPLALLLAACSSGLDNFTPPPDPADDEPLPTGVTTFGLDVGAGAALGAQAVTGAVVQGISTYVLAAFTSSEDGTTLDADLGADANGAQDVFLALFDVDGNQLDVVLASQVAAGGSSGDGASGEPAITFVPNTGFSSTDVSSVNSAGTIFVAYSSTSTDIAAGDANGNQGVFRAAFELTYDAESGATTADANSVRLVLDTLTQPPVLVSVRDGFANSGSGTASAPAIAPDGSGVAFLSSDTDLSLLADADGDLDLYVRLVDADRTLPVSTTADGSALASGGDCDAPVYARSSARALAFASQATDHVDGDTNGVRDVFYCLLDLDTESVGAPRLVSQQPDGDIGSGGDSRAPSLFVDVDTDEEPTRVLVAFESDKTDLTSALPPLTTTSVYLYEQDVSGAVPLDPTVLLVNQRLDPSGGEPGTAQGGTAPADSSSPTLSSDGSQLAFASLADDLDTARADENGVSDIYVADLSFLSTSGTLRHQRASATASGASGDDASSAPVFAQFQGGVEDADDVVTFSNALATTFMQDRCLTCHGFNNTAFPGDETFDAGSTVLFESDQSGDPNLGGFVGPHPGKGPFIGLDDLPIDNSAQSQQLSCFQCHREEYTGVPVFQVEVSEGDPDFEDFKDRWRTPEPSLEFRGKTVSELCAMVLALDSEDGITGNVVEDIEEHFFADPRINWALDNAKTPDPDLPTSQAIQKQPSFPGQLQAGVNVGDGADASTTTSLTLPGSTLFFANVQAWIDDGLICNDATGGGDFLTFFTLASNLGASSGSNVVGILTTTAIERVSKTSGLAPEGGAELAAASSHGALSGDDRFVVFQTDEPIDIDVDGDGVLDRIDENNATDIYVRDLFLGTTTLVSHTFGGASAANGDSTQPSIAVGADGTLFIAFQSLATDLSPGFVDGNGPEAADVYVAEFSGFNGSNPSTIDVRLASRSVGQAGRGGNAASGHASVAGTWPPRVAFESLADDLVAGFVDNNGADAQDVFLLEGFSLSLVSGVLASSTSGDAASWEPALSTDGSAVAFTTLASDLAASFVDNNGAQGSDVVLHDLGAGQLSLVSQRESGGTGQGGDDASHSPSIDDSGSFVAFASLAHDLVSGFQVDASASSEVAIANIFVRDLAGESTELASDSTSSSTQGGDGDSARPSLAPDGSAVAYDSLATDLVAADVNGLADVFVHTLGASGNERISLAQGISDPDGASTNASLGMERASFDSLATSLPGVNVDTNGVSDVYRVDL